MNVLIAEDDRNIRAGLKEILEAEGFRVLEACDGREALHLFETETPDFLCLDIMMPEMNGYDVCRQIRRQNATVPIIFITAKSEEIDKVLGLELGADDFIVKPFGIREVVARIRAVARRCLAAGKPPTSKEQYRLGDLTVIPNELRAVRGEQVIDLSLREVKILTLLSENPGRVLSRDEIFDKCWGATFFPSSRTLDQHIAKLRKRIERNPKSPEIIKTVHGVGYRFDMTTDT
jgi:DNA-binding response OmpR family regulator